MADHSYTYHKSCKRSKIFLCLPAHPIALEGAAFTVSLIVHMETIEHDLTKHRDR